MEDVADAPVLNVSERGDRAYIGISEEQLLDHPWSGNVVDLCPVGSLLSKDFLHKARAWDLDKSASVCPGCTQGCNINIDTRDDVVVRLRPRPNLEVNRHFICDHGRMDYRWMNRGDRIEAPLVREGAAACRRRLGHRARPAGAGGSGRVGLGGRARLGPGVDRIPRAGTARWWTASTVTAAVQVPLGEEAPLAGVPNLALRRERAPNLAGAELLGYTRQWEAALRQAPPRPSSSCSTPT